MTEINPTLAFYSRIHTGIEGRYKLIVRKADTLELVRETAESPNIITNIGLDQLAVGATINTCYVGTGTGVPAATDTTLFNYLTNTSTITASGTGTASGAPLYYTEAYVTFRFPTGVAAGNLTEVGVGWSTLPTGAIFSHALIVDGGGTPTSITVLADEVLDVTYIWRFYPNVTDVNTPSVTIGGVGYSCVTRPALVNSWSPSAVRAQAIFASGGSAIAYSGALGLITSNPAGSSSNATSTSVGSYTAGSFTRRAIFTWNLGAGNVGGIQSVQSYWGASAACRFQTSFSPNIPKDNTKVLSLTFDVTWGRYTI